MTHNYSAEFLTATACEIVRLDDLAAEYWSDAAACSREGGCFDTIEEHQAAMYAIEDDCTAVENDARALRALASYIVSKMEDVSAERPFACADILREDAANPWPLPNRSTYADAAPTGEAWRNVPYYSPLCQAACCASGL